MPTIHAVYASTSGNTELVIDAVAVLWRQLGLTVETHRAERTNPSLIQENELFLFGTSTWDHGTINPFFLPLYEAMSTIDCSAKAALFIGMGDNRYEPVLFNMGIQHILERWLERGGKEIHHPLKVNGDPRKVFESLIKPWVAESGNAILNLGSSIASIPSKKPDDIPDAHPTQQEVA